MKTLTINKDCVYKIKIEKLKEFENSFFTDVYFKATEALIDITNSNYNKNESNNSNYENKEDEFNNIIAFVGERGTGKSSSMISFKNSLHELEDIKELSKNKELKRNYNKIDENKFHILDTIDPSVFNGKDSIIEIVVAEMFKKFKGETNNRDYIKKQELVKRFEIVYKDLRTLNKDKLTIFNENMDNLEVLMDLSSAIALKSDIQKLVNSYLQYMKDENDSGKNNFLVITIDDLDMNIAAGEKMIEDIRKYLIIPRVVIMMAVKFEQLEEVIKQKNIKDLKLLADYYKDTDKLIKKNEREYMTKALNGELNNKTNKYLEKVIPYNKRIYMPSIYEGKVKIKVDFYNFENKENNSIEIFLIEIFYQYLNYIILTKKHSRAILPNNLRGFIDLLVLFSKLEMLEINKKENVDIENDKIIKNLTAIIKYLNKDIDDKINNFYMNKFLKDILQCPIKEVNKKILLHLNEELYDNKDIIDNEILNYLDELVKMERNVIDESISLGDVITWIKLYEGFVFLDEEKIFIELLKEVYSIRLITELYTGSEEMIHIIGKDVVGKYFEFARNRHSNKIESEVKFQPNELSFNLNDLEYNISEKDELKEYIKNYVDEKSIQEKDGLKSYRYKKQSILKNEVKEFLEKSDDEALKKAIKSYYLMLDPQYINSDSFRLSKFYREHINTLEEKLNTMLKNFYFKPLNVLGVNEDIYKKLSSVNDREIIFVNYKEQKDDEKQIKSLLVNDYILLMNIDFYMQVLKGANKDLENYRFKKEDNSTIIIDSIYKIIEENFSNLCDKCSYLNININSPIEGIIKNKDLNLKYIGENIVLKGNKVTEVDKNIETVINNQIDNIDKLRTYLLGKLEGNKEATGNSEKLFIKFESTLRKRIEEIKNLNKRSSKISIRDINSLSEKLLNIINPRKREMDLQKEKIRIDNIINDSIKEIDEMLKILKK